MTTPNKNDKKVVSLSMFDTVTACNAGSDMELLLPNGEGSGVFITMLGTDGDEYKKYQREIQNEFLRQLASKKKKSPKEAIDEAELSESKNIELLVRLTVGWKDMPSPDGKGVLVFSKENCRMVYTKYPMIRRQADLYVADLTNFMKS